MFPRQESHSSRLLGWPAGPQRRLAAFYPWNSMATCENQVGKGSGNGCQKRSASRAAAGTQERPAILFCASGARSWVGRRGRGRPKHQVELLVLLLGHCCCPCRHQHRRSSTKAQSATKPMSRLLSQRVWRAACGAWRGGEARNLQSTHRFGRESTRQVHHSAHHSQRRRQARHNKDTQRPRDESTKQ